MALSLLEDAATFLRELLVCDICCRKSARLQRGRFSPNSAHGTFGRDRLNGAGLGVHPFHRHLLLLRRLLDAVAVILLVRLPVARLLLFTLHSGFGFVP